MPKISVIVPIYNAENFLERCIDSLLAQNEFVRGTNQKIKG